jgi:hypothetical protein
MLVNLPEEKGRMTAGGRRMTGGGEKIGGLAGWLLKRLRLERRPRPRLELVERITVAPRQSLALVEAEGRRFLIATSPEGSPAFYPLDERGSRPGRGRARVSW